MAAFQVVTGMWEECRAEVRDEPFVPDKTMEMKGHISVCIRAWTKVYTPEVRAQVEGENERSRVELAHRAIRHRLVRARRAAASEGDPLRRATSEARVAALEELERRSRTDHPLRDLLAGLEMAGRKGLGRAPATARHTRYYLSSGGYEERSIVTTAQGHTALEVARGTAPPEIPSESVAARLAHKGGDRPQWVKDGASTAMGRYLGRERPDLLRPNEWCVCVGGSFTTSAPHLGEYFPKGTETGTYVDVATALRVAGHQLRLPKLGPLTSRAFSTTGVNPPAHPGYLSAQLGRSKGQLADVGDRLAREVWEALEVRQLYDRTLWATGGREKRQWRGMGDQLKSRIVMMPEAATSQFAQAIAIPITMGLSQTGGDLKIGFSMSHGKWRRFKRHHDLEHVKAFDWSSFDGRVRETLLVSAMAVLRACYPAGVQMDRAFIYILSNLVFKRLITPGGHVVVLDGGVPSGHPFTSLVDSVANWLIHKTVLAKLGGWGLAVTTRVSVCGDDTLVSFPDGSLAPDTPSYLTAAEVMWGAKGKLEATMEGFLCSAWPDKALPFLGTRFINGFPGISPEDFISMELGDAHPRLDMGMRAEEVYMWTGLPPFCSRQVSLHRDLLRYATERGGSWGIQPQHSEAVMDWVIGRAGHTYVDPHSTGWGWGGMGGTRVPLDKLTPPHCPPSQGDHLAPGWEDKRFPDSYRRGVYGTMRRAAMTERPPRKPPPPATAPAWFTGGGPHRRPSWWSQFVAFVRYVLALMLYPYRETSRYLDG